MDPTVSDVFSTVSGRFSNGFQRFSVFSYGIWDNFFLNGLSGLLCMRFTVCTRGGMILRSFVHFSLPSDIRFWGPGGCAAVVFHELQTVTQIPNAH